MISRIDRKSTKNDILQPNGENNSNFSYSSAIAQEKHERLARSSLQDLIFFSEALDSEVTRLQYNQNPTPDEQELLKRMLVTKGKFDLAIQSMRSENNDESRHALISFADSAQDLITFIYKGKAH